MRPVAKLLPPQSPKDKNDSTRYVKALWAAEIQLPGGPTADQEEDAHGKCFDATETRTRGKNGCHGWKKKAFAADCQQLCVVTVACSNEW